MGRMGDPAPPDNNLSEVNAVAIPTASASPGGAPAQFTAATIGPLARGRVSTMIGDRELSLEVGRVGPLADAVVFARFGATTVLASAVSSWSPAVGGSFLPLQVDYIEKAFAAGQIPSTFTRRESSSSDRELLAARAIDRSLRPLFDSGYFYDTQIICSVMSFDPDCDPGMLSILAASAALHVRAFCKASIAAFISCLRAAAALRYRSATFRLMAPWLEFVLACSPPGHPNPPCLLLGPPRTAFPHSTCSTRAR